ncbi:MAG: putative superfamily transporter inner rane protein [Firmicutes bacterium]|nr:putative superfamily transporter inner rane protein [Bacillota bacterium]
MQLKANFLLLLAAIIWGLAFVAQRVGMDHIQPFTFNGLRFLLGSLSLIPLIFYYSNHQQAVAQSNKTLTAWQAGIIAGLVLFLGASLQQVGLLYTTAGKAAFITCLYIILVPIAGIFFHQRISANTWLGSVIAVIGLYFLSMKDGFYISYGDMLELIGAIFWTAHILIIGYFSSKVDILKLALFQFITCSALSLFTALLIETITLSGIIQAGIPLLYGGICSVGIAYTLQIVGQKHAAPAHAAIILSMEMVFAALGGFAILDEKLAAQEFLGCILMFAGMLIAQHQTSTPQEIDSTSSV